MKMTCCPLLRLFGFIMFAVLAACTQTPEDLTGDAGTAERFAVNTFPEKFFDAGYSESYVITGSDQEGRSYTGEFKLETGNETIFYGAPAVPVTSNLSYSRPINGVAVAPITYMFTEYFSVSVPRKYLGSEHSDTAVIMLPVTLPVEIPVVLNAEGSGSAGDFIGTDSSAESISWSLLKVADDDFLLSYFSEVTDSAGNVIDSEAQTFNIDSTGERHAWSFDVVQPVQGITLSFSGERI